MLTGIEIENFRGIREGKVEGFGAVNVVVGPNGSGKSTLLEAIFLGATDGSKPMIGNTPTREVLVRRHNEQSFPSAEMRYGKDGEKIIEVTYNFDEYTTTYSITKGGVGWKPSVPEGGSRKYFDAAKLLDVRLLFDKAVEQATWDATLTIRADRDIVKRMNEIFGLAIEGFSYSPYTNVLKVLFTDRDFSLNIDDLGAGMRIAFRILMIAALTNNSALIIEEFDAYQHVDSLPKFARALVKIATENATQLFLATHSEETIRRFIEAVEDEGIDFRLIQTKLTADGVFETASLEAARASRLLDAGIDVRQAG